MRNSLVSYRRNVTSVDKSCTDSAKDCKASRLGEEVAPTASVCSSSQPLRDPVREHCQLDLYSSFQDDQRCE